MLQRLRSRSGIGRGQAAAADVAAEADDALDADEWGGIAHDWGGGVSLRASRAEPAGMTRMGALVGGVR